MNYLDFDRAKLVDVLSTVKPGLAKKDVIAQADKFVFKDGSVYTYNDEIAVAHKIEHVTPSCAVPAVELYTLLNNMTDPTVHIAIEGDVLHIKGAKLTAKIKIESTISLAVTDAAAPGMWYPIPVNFSDAIGFTQLSVGTDLSKPILTCIHWTKDYMESCDNFRLTRYTISTPDLAMPVLLSNKVVEVLRTYNPIEYSLQPGWAQFKVSPECTLSCKVYSGSFVNLDPFLQVAYTKEIGFTDAVLTILERVKILAETDIHGKEKALLTIAGGVATVSSHNQHGEITDFTRVRCDSDLAFEFKIETLQHILERSKKAQIDDTKKSLKFSGTTETIVVDPEADPKTPPQVFKNNWVHTVSLC